jgi:hypothetical protein
MNFCRDFFHNQPEEIEIALTTSELMIS